MEFVIAVIISAIGYIGYAVIGERIIFSKRKDKYFKKKKTIRFFTTVFILSAFEDVCLLLYTFDLFPQLLFRIIMIIKAISILITLFLYWSEIPIFQRKEIPLSVHKNSVENIKKKFKEEINQTELSENTKKELCNSLNSYR